jgi:receptor protein-tyrosine kinase
MADPASSTLIEKAADRLGKQAQQPVSAASEPNLVAPPESMQQTAVTHQPAEPAPTTESTTTRKIEIDYRRLESLGIFSPDHGTNRTTEEIRLIKRAVLSNASMAKSEQARNHNLIMVTSSRQGEGKSFVAFNLAMSLASETDKTVLLIDADSSRSSVVRMLGIDAEEGFLDLLEDENISFADVMIKTDAGHLSIIPAGHPHVLSSELFAGSKAGSLLQEMSRRYQDRIIIVDAPPVLATSEPTALALHVGQIVFVVDAQKSTKGAIGEALGLINVCPNIGFVLNKAEYQFGASRFGSYHDYYDYSRPRSRRKVRRDLRAR